MTKYQIIVTRRVSGSHQRQVYNANGIAHAAALVEREKRKRDTMKVECYVCIGEYFPASLLQNVTLGNTL